MKSFYDEPTDSPGASQILTDSTKTTTGEKNAQAWLRATDNTTKRKPSFLAVVCESIVWTSGAALISKVVLGVQKLITLGLVVESHALIVLLFVALLSMFLAYRVYTERPSDFYLRAGLFIVGILIAVV